MMMLNVMQRDPPPSLRIEQGQAVRNMRLSPLAQQGALNKRAVAAEFVSDVTGTEIPCASDLAFRQALHHDGLLLCKLANVVWPGIISQVRTHLH